MNDKLDIFRALWRSSKDNQDTLANSLSAILDIWESMFVTLVFIVKELFERSVYSYSEDIVIVIIVYT